MLECFGLLEKRFSPPPFLPSQNLSSMLDMSFYPSVLVALPYTSHSQPAAYILSRPVYIICYCLLCQCALYSAHWLAYEKCTIPAQDRGNERKVVSDLRAWPTPITYPPTHQCSFRSFAFPLVTKLTQKEEKKGRLYHIPDRRKVLYLTLPYPSLSKNQTHFPFFLSRRI